MVQINTLHHSAWSSRTKIISSIRNLHTHHDLNMFNLINPFPNPKLCWNVQLFLPNQTNYNAINSLVVNYTNFYPFSLLFCYPLRRSFLHVWDMFQQQQQKLMRHREVFISKQNRHTNVCVAIYSIYENVMYLKRTVREIHSHAYCHTTHTRSHVHTCKQNVLYITSLLRTSSYMETRNTLTFTQSTITSNRMKSTRLRYNSDAKM